MNPERIRERLALLDRLDAFFNAESTVGHQATEIETRARHLAARLEEANRAQYEAIRIEIRSGLRPELLLQWGKSRRKTHGISDASHALGYDDLDELVSGILRFDEPDESGIVPEPEKVRYQPTPARLIFDLLEETALTADDVLVDLGSGLGHVPLLASMCTPARSVGIEIEEKYVERAQSCAHGLNLVRAAFVRQDVREADLASGTVFYLYTPFEGSILRRVLDRLRDLAGKRRFRVCTYGPSTVTVAKEPWLQAACAPNAERVTGFTTGA